jgi:acyl-CoA thioester hydrolase
MIPFERSFTAQADDIDELGHVNNAVWLRWIQDMATSHWQAVAAPEHIAAGESVTARTWIESEPKGAQFDRRVDFVDAKGKVIVRANTTWAMIDKATGRLVRVRPEVSAPFME